MRISKIEFEHQDSHLQISADIGTLNLWFRVPVETPIDLNDATPFVQICLIPAMMLGEDIEVDEEYSISPKFLSCIDQIHSIYSTWNPIFKSIKVVGRKAPPALKTRGGGCFFSGGVDGTYTFLKYREKINQLIQINGFDANYSTENWSQMVEKNRSFAENMGVGLIPVETNHRSFLAAFGLSGFANFSFRLAAVGELLGFETLFVSGAETYRTLFPSGSHPMLDPLLSTETTEVHHTGLEADRTAKLAYIAQYQEALHNLNFCVYGGVVNCGRCTKCVRTHVALLLNEIRQFPFEKPVSLSQIKRVKIVIEEQAEFFESFKVTAIERGMLDLANILKRLLIRYRLKKLIAEIEATYFPFITMIRKKRLPKEDQYVSVNVYQRYSDKPSLEYYRKRLESDFVQEKHEIGTVY